MKSDKSKSSITQKNSTKLTQLFYQKTTQKTEYNNFKK